MNLLNRYLRYIVKTVLNATPHIDPLTDLIRSKSPLYEQYRLGSTVNLENLLFGYFDISIQYNLDLARKNLGKALGNKYLAWNLSYDLIAAVEAFHTSRNPLFLDYIDTCYPTVIDMIDANLNISDFQGVSRYAWGTNRYSDHKRDWVVWDAYAGMILYPFAKYSELILFDEGICSKYLDQAKIYAEFVGRVLNEFDFLWREDGDTGYHFDPYYNDIAPLNHMTILGAVYALYWRISGNDKWLHRALFMAKFFKKAIRTDSRGTYVWDYWPASHHEPSPLHAEDATHAYINLLFAYTCFRLDIVFTDSDMRGFANTMIHNILANPARPSAFLDGDGNMYLERVHEGLLGWSLLKPWAKEIPLLIEDQINRNPSLYRLGWFSYATGPYALALTLQPS